MVRFRHGEKKEHTQTGPSPHTKIAVLKFSINVFFQNRTFSPPVFSNSSWLTLKLKIRITTAWKWNMFCETFCPSIYQECFFLVFQRLRFVADIFLLLPKKMNSCLFEEIGDPSAHLYKLSFLSFPRNEFNHWTRIFPSPTLSLSTDLSMVLCAEASFFQLFHVLAKKCIHIQIDIIYGGFTNQERILAFPMFQHKYLLNFTTYLMPSIYLQL